MYIRVTDGIAQFGKWLLRCKPPLKNIPFRVEPEGIICYTKDELVRAKKMMDGMKVPYEKELALEPPQGACEITAGVIYSSRSEALAHIEGKEPESLVIPRLKERLAAAEAETRETRSRAEAAETQAKAAEEKAELAETKAIQAEEKALQAEAKALAATEKMIQVERLVEEIGRQADKKE